MSARTQVVNGVTFFTSQAKKQIALFPRIPMTQFRFFVDMSKGEALEALKRMLKRMSDERIVAFRYDLQLMQVEQHKITCFEQVRAAKQAGAAALYRSALKTLIATANAELASRVDLSDNLLFTYDDLTARDSEAAAAGAQA